MCHASQKIMSQEHYVTKEEGEKNKTKKKMTEINIAPAYANIPNLLSYFFLWFNISYFRFVEASDATGHHLDIITEELQFCDLSSKNKNSWQT